MVIWSNYTQTIYLIITHTVMMAAFKTNTLLNNNK